MALVLLKRLDLVLQVVDILSFGGKFLLKVKNISSTLFKFSDFVFFLLQAELDFLEFLV